MLAIIDELGTLQLKAEDETESFALKQWWMNWSDVEDEDKFSFTCGDNPNWLMIENDAGNDNGTAICVLADIKPLNKTDWLEPEEGE